MAKIVILVPGIYLSFISFNRNQDGVIGFIMVYQCHAGFMIILRRRGNYIYKAGIQTGAVCNIKTVSLVINTYKSGTASFNTISAKAYFCTECFRGISPDINPGFLQGIRTKGYKSADNSIGRGEIFGEMNFFLSFITGAH